MNIHINPSITVLPIEERFHEGEYHLYLSPQSGQRSSYKFDLTHERPGGGVYNIYNNSPGEAKVRFVLPGTEGRHELNLHGVPRAVTEVKYPKKPKRGWELNVKRHY